MNSCLQTARLLHRHFVASVGPLVLGILAASGCGSSECAAPSNQTCATPLDRGSMYGDETGQDFVIKGVGSQFVTVLVQEVSWSNRPIGVHAVLTPASPGTAFGLRLFVPNSVGGSACSGRQIGANAAGGSSVVETSWPDLNDGSSQDNQLVFEITQFGGTCGANWSLRVDGVPDPGA